MKVKARARGATPHPRSGAAAESARLQWHRNGREELPHNRGQRQQPGGATPRPRSAAAAERSYPASEVRGSGRECQAATAQEQPKGATPRPRSSGCVGSGGPRGAIPRSRSGGAAVRRYPSSKVRSSDCTLLEQP